MKDLKLRAWDKIDNKMYYDAGFSMYGIQIYKNDYDFPEEIVLDRGKSCFIEMLCTGLKDKFGTYIYDSDIIAVPFGCGDARYQAVVRWDDEKTGFHPFVNGYIDEIEIVPAYKTEIIGNIYENPELLQSKGK